MADVGWKMGLPPGKYYPGMKKDYEVYFSPAGQKWHRRKEPEPSRLEAAEIAAAKISPTA